MKKISESDDPTLQEIGKIKDVIIPLGEAALLLASRDRPDISLDRYRKHLSQITQRVEESYLEKKQTDTKQIDILKSVLVSEYGYCGDTDSYDSLQNANLIQVIDRRKGLPITLGIIYIHAARAQGWNIEGLNFPGHFLLRIEDGADRTIFDPFNDCKTIETPDMRALIKKTLGNNAELSANHYRAASNREILIRLQNNKKIRLLKSKKITEALTVVESMLEFSPSSPEIWYEAGILHKYLGSLQAAIIAFNHCYDISTSTNQKHQVTQILNEIRNSLN